MRKGLVISMRVGRKYVILVLAVLLLLPAFAFAEEGEAASQPATDLSDAIVFEKCGHYNLKDKLIGSKMMVSEDWVPFERFFFSIKPMTDARWLCIQWTNVPEEVELQQLDETGAVLARTDVPEEYDFVWALEENTVRIAFNTGKHGMSLTRLALYSEGVLPEPFYHWQYAAGHLDYLVISTHPDDDVLYMGGVVPIYGGERGYTGTVVFVTTPNRLRVHEAVLGVRTMGGETYPLFIGFHDVTDEHMKEHINMFLSDAVTLSLVRIFRQQRPLVVFTHDVNGEYGHWQHKVVSASTVEACKLAADESYDPASAAEFGVWEVKKCYLHLYAEDPLVLDVNAPLVSFGGKSAMEVAREAFLKHGSQQTGRFRVQADWDPYPISQLGMAYGTVEAGTDAFDNIDPQLLVSALSNDP